MALFPGEKLGSYEIVEFIGRGGMGEVYRATDLKLKREVALKVLPAALADDPARMARFQREAEVLASLNHPNIAQIYGIEESNGVRAIVMELVKGETLKGPLPADAVFSYARQIAEALEAAHEKNIVHRDLKPSNVMITSTGVIKVLDFGLAAVLQKASFPGSKTADSPTLTIGATQAGVLMGTASYMSPEQAAGKPVDKRSDIWSFGVVLWEVVTGKRLFDGETIAQTLAEVLREPIDLDKLPSGTPASIRYLLRRCLERDVRKRLRDIGEARVALEEGPKADAQPSATPSRLRFSVAPWLTAGLLLVTTLAISLIHFREPRRATDVVRFQISAPERVSIGSPLGSVLRLSPDGRRIAFVATGPDGRTSLWLRSLETLEARRLAGTEDATASLWSADGRSLVFGVAGKLKKIEVSGGPPQTLCDISSNFYGGSWNRDGVIIFSTESSGLWRVSATGGVASRLTELDASHQEGFHSPPVFLPDGRHFIYFRAARVTEYRGLYVGALDTKPQQQSSRRLLATDSSAAYAPSLDPSVGHLLFLREGTLMAQPFDISRLKLTGEAVPIADNIGSSGVNGWFSASATGVLAYLTGVGAGRNELTWFDRAGEVLGTVGEPSRTNTPALSPDGTRVAFGRRSIGGAADSINSEDIWVQDLSRGTSTRLTFDPVFAWTPVWSPDSSRIVFGSRRDGGTIENLYQKASSGAGNEDALLKSGERKIPYDWSQDGRFLIYGLYGGPGKGFDLWFLPLTGDDHKPAPYLQTDANEFQARFSPDGHLVAYVSDESGKTEVYVQPFPLASGGKWIVSKGGGTQPRWRRDGKEVFYISTDSKLMAVDVITNPTFKAGAPKALFAAPIVGGGSAYFVADYDVTADGQKFLINTLRAEGSASITAVLNWQAGLKR